MPPPSWFELVRDLGPRLGCISLRPGHSPVANPLRAHTYRQGCTALVGVSALRLCQTNAPPPRSPWALPFRARINTPHYFALQLSPSEPLAATTFPLPPRSWPLQRQYGRHYRRCIAHVDHRFPPAGEALRTAGMDSPPHCPGSQVPPVVRPER